MEKNLRYQSPVCNRPDTDRQAAPINIHTNVPGFPAGKPRLHFASIAPHEKLTKIDFLHVVPVIDAALPFRIYAAWPLTELPHALIRYVLETALVFRFPSGALAVDPETNRRSYLALLDGEMEVCRETIGADGSEEIQVSQLLKSATSQGIILLHCIPRRSRVRALSAVQVLMLDAIRVEALLAWMHRCDTRRKPKRAGLLSRK